MSSRFVVEECDFSNALRLSFDNGGDGVKQRRYFEQIGKLATAESVVRRLHSLAESIAGGEGVRAPEWLREAMASEEAWREAVREVRGADDYSAISVIAARKRREAAERLYAECDHTMEPQPLYDGAMCCRKCGMGVLRSATAP